MKIRYRQIKFKKKYRKLAARQIFAIILLSCIIAVCVNHFRSSGIPIVKDWSAQNRLSDDTGDSLVISLERASRLFEKNEALFLDARPESQYAKGHIKGALSLPWQEADRRFAEVAGRLEGNKTIITYCDGEACELSHDLALFLADMGFKNVRVLTNGWTRWQEAELPVEKGGRGNGRAET